MHRYVMAFPVVPGKSEAEVVSLADYFRSNPSDYHEARQSVGITFERAYFQHTPMGDFVVAYVETEHPFGQTMQALIGSEHPVNQRFVQHVRDVHGVDLTQPPAGPEPETVAWWWNETVSDRGHGFAFVAPLIPGKTEQGREWANEAFVNRREELAASRQHLGLWGEVVTVAQTPHGDVCCVYIEGNDPVHGNASWAMSTEDYDVWFKDQLGEIFPAEINFNHPVPGVHEIFDSEALLATR